MTTLLRRTFLMALSGGFFASSILAQHDGARNAVQQIALGNLDRAAKELDNKKRDAGEIEARFVEMLALLAEDRTGPALAKAREAVKLGLPFERLLAGPRPLLDKLHALDEFARWKSEIDPPILLHGPMVGDITPTAVSLWIRTDGPATLPVSVTGPDGDTHEALIATTAEADHTGIARIPGLAPDTAYRVQVDRVEHSFRTAPAPGPSRLRVAFGGGAGYVPEWESMWDTIREFRPRAMLMLGDNVYIDQPEHTLCQHYCYYRRQSRPEWRRLVGSTAMYAIWDDHDFGDNDCIPGPHTDKPAWKRQVWNIFRQNWVNPAYGGGKDQPGCWYDFTLADIHFIMLDGRYYRDLAGKTMLGPAQKKWLWETLGKSAATFTCLVSPVPFSPGIKPGSRDPWDGFPEEREEIFRKIEEEKIEGVILVAADRHRTDLRTIARPGGYRLYEFESSRLTNVHTHKVVKTDELIWGYNETCSFGLMTFDTTLEDPTVTFECVNIKGEVVESYLLQRSSLSFAASGD